jgi:uncharacterized repeat protein (TIGR01451 family)
MNQRWSLKILEILFGVGLILITLLAWNRLAVQAAPLALPAAVDVGVSKADSPDPVLVGDRLTYTVIVRNVETARARAVVMTDTLPAGLTFASVSTTKGVCLRTGNTIRCTLGNLNKGTSVQITVAVTPTVAGVFTNTATIVTTSPDNNAANDTVSISTTVLPKSDLMIGKHDTPDPVFVGNALSYSLVVTNAGPSAATNVMVTDTLPLNVAFEAASSGCNLTGQLVVCAVGTLANGAARALTVTVTPGVLAAGTLINTALVRGGEADPIAANNTASSTTTVNPQADLSVGQSAAPIPAFLGNLLVYTLTLTNNGPSPASDVLLTDTLPAGVTLASIPAGCTPVGGEVVCTAGVLGSGSTLIYTLVVIPSALGPITNTVTAAGSTFDPDFSNNANAGSIDVIPAADLIVVKASTPSVVLPGDVITYTLAITNSGPSTAANVVATDALPADVLLQSFAASQGTCNSIGLIICNLGTINGGGTAAVSIVVTATTPVLLINTAAVASSIADPDLTNNASTQVVAVSPVDLAVSKTASANAVLTGDPLTYTIVVANYGPLDGTNVRLTDTLPANVELGSVTTSQGGCGGGSVVVCALGALNSGEVTTVTLVVTATSTGLAVNTAIVEADQPDPDSVNNLASAATAVNPADLSVSKTAMPGPVFTGDVLAYTLVVTNNGPSNAASTIVTDELPLGVTFASASPGCLSTGSQVLCSAGTLSPGGQQAFTVTVNVGLAAEGIITNSATAGSAAPDIFLPNNTAAVATTVLPQADLSVSLSDSPDPVYVGAPLNYVINVANHGPAMATHVLLTQTLPAGVTVSSVPAECVSGSGVVTCALGAFPANSGLSLLVEVMPTAAASSQITSTATLGAAEHDPQGADNTVNAGTTVVAVADLSVTKTSQPNPARSTLPLIYTIVVTNAGPSAASGVLLTDTLPPAVTFNAASPGCGQSTGIVTCPLGTLTAGLARTIVITVTPQGSTAGILLENIVAATGDQFDPNLADNTYLLGTAIDPADLSVVKTAAPNPVVTGNPLTYTLVVNNAGPSGATDVVVFDTLPLSVSFKSASAGCVESGGLVTCDLPNLAVGDNDSVSIVVTPTAAGLIANAALVDANEADNNPANDLAMVETTVIAGVDLALSKTTAQTSLLPGQPITYTLLVTNTSQLPVSGLTLSDTLPLAVTSPAWTCTATPGSTCGGSGAGQNLLSTLDLAAGGRATYFVTGVVDVSTRGLVTNTATLILPAGYADPVAGNNTATATTRLWSLLYLPLIRR